MKLVIIIPRSWVHTVSRDCGDMWSQWQTDWKFRAVVDVTRDSPDGA